MEALVWSHYLYFGHFNRGRSNTQCMYEYTSSIALFTVMKIIAVEIYILVTKQMPKVELLRGF